MIYKIKKIPRKLKKASRIAREEGLLVLSKKVKNALVPQSSKPLKKDCYKRWIKEMEPRHFEGNKNKLAGLRRKPRISVIVPVYNVDPKCLRACINSVKNQIYDNWELCIYDDASTNQKTINYLKKVESESHSRIKIDFGQKNLHISGASNKALAMVTGEYVALIDNDDELTPDALLEVAKVLDQRPGLKYIYSDEDKIDEGGRRYAPFFKPDWNPDLLLSQMYTSHLSVFDCKLLKKIGGFRIGYEGAQDYDLVLRVTENIKREEIFHIPKILYHWRALDSSTASGHGNKGYTFDSAKKALTDYLKRKNIKGSVEDGLAPGSYRVKREIVGNPEVDIIIPFTDKVSLLKRAIKSILKKTEYNNYRIILVNNGSKEEATKKYLDSLRGNPKIRMLAYNKPFNFSAINNFAVSQTDAEYVLLLNNDIEVITEGWLSSMLEQAQRKEVGAVGAKLLYSDDRIQHAGIILGTGVAGHSHKYFQDNDYGYFSQLSVIRDFAAVTGACLLVSRKKYLEVGGLNEKELKVAFNDIDFCLKLLVKGYLNVYVPYAKLYHFESASRGYEIPEEIKKKNKSQYERIIAELKYMKDKWGELIENDPYYSPNLTRVSEDFSLRFKEDEL